jgi:hypothetical protein
LSELSEDCPIGLRPEVLLHTNDGFLRAEGGSVRDRPADPEEGYRDAGEGNRSKRRRARNHQRKRTGSERVTGTASENKI